MSLEPTERVDLTPASTLSERSENKAIAWSAYYELTKPRLSLLSVITALVGYLAALPERDLSVLIFFLGGTAICAAGAATLNQYIERGTDALMKRTRERPLPAGQVSPSIALWLGVALSIIGVAALTFGANYLAGALGFATILTYTAIYTPLKLKTRWATEIGALPGALPPLIGWASAEGGISALGWILFAILSFWQIPHFMAIAWTFRKDYESAGFPMLTVVDPSGRKAGIWATINAVALLAVSVLPIFLGLCSWLYTTVAAVFGIWMLVRSITFATASNRDSSARKLFFNSIFYLPAVLFTLVIDRWILF
ncbi:heme o synthase [Pelagicoccus mobilis]|uniref:Protoheme IX farnesyltransferase n=1 Tax=Pelagicoccus mobilis TaxID=415221 RepID=A0A934RYX7_9BACT|nr:heme o synthase [Pelagicoccus mobilis]MBK1876399.1 protoheme IX farnesyltransferase [Pelagicoccus mobilis]